MYTEQESNDMADMNGEYSIWCSIEYSLYMTKFW